MIQFFFIFSEWGILILRSVLGLILVVNGWPKIKDLKQSALKFSEMGFRPGIFWGTLVALAEFVGGIALITGFLTQIFAFIIAIQFVVILLSVKRRAKFTELQFDLLILASALTLIALGGGSYSLDNFFGLLLY